MTFEVRVEIGPGNVEVVTVQAKNRNNAIKAAESQSGGRFIGCRQV